MRGLAFLHTIAWLLAIMTHAVTAAAATTDGHSRSLKLNITAIGARHGVSTLECWQLDEPFTVSTQTSTAGNAVLTQLGDVSNITFLVVRAMYNGQPHTAPRPQYNIITTGLAVFSIPNNPGAGAAYISGGEFGIIFATDTAAVSKVGHLTQFPGITETINMQIPTKDGKIPAHSVLHYSPCFANETLGLKGLAALGQ